MNENQMRRKMHEREKSSRDFRDEMNEQPEYERYIKDQFGGPHGVDPNSHGAELQ